MILVDDGILLPSGDASLPSTFLTADGTVDEVDLGPGRNLIGAGENGLWRITSDIDAGEEFVVEPIAITGEPTAAPVELPGSPVGFDPAGGFIVEAAGGVYSVAADVRRITTGELLALGSDLALADECDEALDCGLVVIERSSGERRPLDLRVPATPTNPPGRRSLEVIAGASISCDGGAAIVRVIDPVDRSSSQPTLGLIDLETSVLVEIGPAQNIEEAVWTPDGRFVLYNSGGRITAFDRVEGSEAIVAEELIGVDTFAIRPVGDG